MNHQNSQQENNDLPLEGQEIKSTNKKISFFNFILIGIIFIGLFLYMVCVDGMDNILETLQNVDYRWVIGGLGCLVIFWACDILTLHISIKKMYPKQSFANSIKVGMIGQLFNNVTPFASGGQAMQAYELTKTGKRVSDSLSAMAIKFILTQTALVFSTVVVVLLQFEFFKNLLQDKIWFAIFGFTINILAIIIVILAGLKKQLIISITTPIIKLLGKIKILKKPEDTIEKLDKSINNFAEQFKMIKSEKKMVFQIFLISILQSFAYYFITYMVYRAFGNSGISVWQIIPVQALLLLIMIFIPTPGSGLGAEGGFLLLFGSIFKEGTINMSILFWRIYTFYLPIIVGSFFLIPIKFKKKKSYHSK